MRNLDRRFMLVQMAEAVRRLPGSTAECGVFRGFGAALIYRALDGTYGPDDAHHAFDAFEKAGVRCRVNRRVPGGNKDQSEYWKRIKRARSRTRARGEHPFRVIEQLWGFTNTRYRGIAKNLARPWHGGLCRASLARRTSGLPPGSPAGGHASGAQRTHVPSGLPPTRRDARIGFGPVHRPGTGRAADDPGKELA